MAISVPNFLEIQMLGAGVEESGERTYLPSTQVKRCLCWYLHISALGLLFPRALHGSRTKGTCSPAGGIPCSHQVSWVREENTGSQRLKSSPSNIWKDEVNIQDPTGSLDILSVSQGFHPDPRNLGECVSNYPLGKESQGTWALAIPNLPTS